MTRSTTSLDATRTSVTFHWTTSPALVCMLHSSTTSTWTGSSSWTWAAVSGETCHMQVTCKSHANHSHASHMQVTCRSHADSLRHVIHSIAIWWYSIHSMKHIVNVCKCFPAHALNCPTCDPTPPAPTYM